MPSPPGPFKNDAAPPAGLGLGSGVALVAASMIGAGIFTTTGFLCERLPSERDVLLAWVLGGLLALCGALSYGELGAAMPQVGGEYRYVRRIFGRRWGFLCGWVSLLAGFAAPIGGVALAAGAYLTDLGLPGPPRLLAAAIVLALAALQIVGVRGSVLVNDLGAAVKVLLLAAFAVAGFLATPTAAPEPAALAPSPGPFSAPFATALVLVGFAYTGWNAAAYVAGELRRPERTLPRALLLGTALVTVLYLLVNLVFFRAASPAELAGEVEVGAIAARRLLGDEGGRLFGGGIALVLISTALAFTIAGPRVLVAMAEEGQLPAAFARRDARGTPRAALLLQTLVALGMLLFSALDDLLAYVGLTLGIFAGMAVLGLMVLRRREPERPRPFRVPLHPLPPLLFLGLTLWMVVFSAKDGPLPALASAATLVLGLLVEPLLRASGGLHSRG